MPLQTALELAKKSVNTSYWYDDKVNLRILLAKANHAKLKLTNQTRGIVLESSGNLYKLDGCSFSLGYDLVLSRNSELVTSKLDLIEKELQNIVNWIKMQKTIRNQEANIVKHKLLLPLNMNNMHWAAVILQISFELHDGNVYLQPVVKLYLLDSLSGFGASRISVVQEMLTPYLTKFLCKDEQLNLTAEVVEVRRQGDGSSCGPLTVKVLWEILSGKEHDVSPERYTEREIIDLRAEHILDLNDDKFTQQQLHYVEATLQDKRLNGNIAEQARQIYAYLQQLDEVIIKSCIDAVNRFIDIDDELQNVNTSFATMTVKQFEDLDAKHKASMNAIKKWFQTNYINLNKMQLIRNIFKTLPEDKTDAELEWVDGGKDTLVEILKYIKLLHTRGSEPAHPVEASEELIQVKEKQAEFMFNGTIDKDGKPHGEWIEVVGPYSFKGEYQHGYKAKGREEYFDLELNQTIFFDGTRDAMGNILSGWARCLIGPAFDGHKFLICEGYVEEGMFTQRCKFIAIDINSQAFLQAFAFASEGKFAIMNPPNISNDDFELIVKIKSHLELHARDLKYSIDTPGDNIEKLRQVAISKAMHKSCEIVRGNSRGLRIL